MARLLMVLGFFVVALNACVETRAGPVVALPNAYYLQPDRQGQTELVKRDGRAILPGPIAAYAVSGQIVAGALGAWRPQSRSYANDLPFHGGAETRYFILDTATGHLDTALDESAWQRRLAELGIAHPPEIYPLLPWQ